MATTSTPLSPQSYNCKRIGQVVMVSQASYSTLGHLPVRAMTDCSGRGTCRLFPNPSMFLSPDVKGCPFKDALDVQTGRV